MKTSLLIVPVALVMAVLYGMNLQHGNLNQDEGWYLYAARSVADGKMPYRDFAYTQAPALPYVYSLASPLVREHGLVAGRVTTQVFGLISILLAALLAACLANRAGPEGGPRYGGFAFLLCLTMAGINVFQSYYFTVVKTYGLTACFFLAGCLLAVLADRRRWWLAPLAGLALALAAGTRLSAGLGLPIVGFTLVALRKERGDWPWLAYGAGGAAGLALVFLPFAMAAPEGFRFGLLDYHQGRVAANPLTLKAGFVARQAQDYLVAFGSLAALVLLWMNRVAPRRLPGGFTVGFAVLLLAISGLHLGTAFPYDDYQVFIYPLFCALVAAGLAPVAAGHRWLAPLLVLLCIATAFSSPINQEWFIRGRDRVWWKSKEKPDLALLQEAAAWVRELAAGGTELLTQDTYLAVEADMDVPPGLEMGPFSLYPEMSDERAKTLRLHNRESLLALLRSSEAPVAAVSGYGLSIGCPQVEELSPRTQEALWQALEARYVPVFDLPHFGQGHTTLRVLRRPQ